MTVLTDTQKHQVTIHGDHGTEITLTWSGALVLGTLLREASIQAEPTALPGRTYAPAIERDRR